MGKMARTRRPGGFLSLEAVGHLAGGSTLRDTPLSRLAVFSAWGRAVGPTLGCVTKPALFARGRLVVDVSDPVWVRELERLAPQVLSRLHEHLPPGSVTALSYRIRPGEPAGGPVGGAATRPPRSRG